MCRASERKQESDSKESGSFFRSVKLTTDCIDKIKSFDFYYGSPDKETGELKKSKTYWVRAVNILNIISIANQNKHFYISKEKTFRDSCDNFQKLDEILEVLETNGLVRIIRNKFSAWKYEIANTCVGESKMYMTRKELNIYNKINSKSKKRGNKASASGNIKINISFQEFHEKMISAGKDEITITNQWNIISGINHTGSIVPKRKRKSRLYSDFTSLSKIVNKYISIDGKFLSSLDAHATYSYLLYYFVKVFGDNNNISLQTELDIFKSIILNSDDVYESISKQIGLSITRNEVKEQMNSFLCDPAEYDMKDNKGLIQKLFQDKFPNMLKIIDRNRKTKRMNSWFNMMESKLFIETSTRLIKNGIKTITKHDAIFFFESDRNIVEQMINDKMLQMNIELRLVYENNDIAFGNPSDVSLDSSDLVSLCHIPSTLHYGEGGKEEGELYARNMNNDTKSNDTKSNDTKSNDTKSNDTKSNDTKSNDTKGEYKMKTKNDITVRKIKNNGTDAWIYRGTEKQIKKSCSKYRTEDDFKDYVLTILNSDINASEHLDDLKIIDSVTKIEPEAKSQEQIERSEFQIVFPSIDDDTEEFEELDIDEMLEDLEPKEPFEWFIIEEREHLSISKRAEAVFGIKSNKVINHKNKDEASESFNNYMANRKYENFKKSYKSLTKDGW